MSGKFAPWSGRFALLAVVAAVCMACGPAPHSSAAPGQARVMDLASFPRSQLTIETASGRKTFQVWLADTPARRSQGLMFVRNLPRDSGMLFLFGDPQPVSMWMKNTFISLDMLFIAADGRVVRIVRRTQPHSLESIESRADVVAVLEIAGGECARSGIEVGDYVRHPSLVQSEPAPQS